MAVRVERRWKDILSRVRDFLLWGLRARWLEHEVHSSDDSAYAAMAAPRQFTAPPPGGASRRTSSL